MAAGTLLKGTCMTRTHRTHIFPLIAAHYHSGNLCTAAIGQTIALHSGIHRNNYLGGLYGMLVGLRRGGMMVLNGSSRSRRRHRQKQVHPDINQLI